MPYVIPTVNDMMVVVENNQVQVNDNITTTAAGGEAGGEDNNDDGFNHLQHYLDDEEDANANDPTQEFLLGDE